MAYASVNPFNNKLIKKYPYATDSEVDAAIDKAQKAFPNGKIHLLKNEPKFLRKLLS